MRLIGTASLFRPTLDVKGAALDAARAAAKRRWSIAAGVLAGVVVIGWSAGWWYAAGRFEREIDRWIQACAAQGVTASYTDRHIRGFPFSLTAHFSAPSVALPAKGVDGLGVEWRAPSVTAEFDVFSPGTIVLANEVRNEVVISRGNARRALAVEATETRLALKAGDKGARNARIDFTAPVFAVAPQLVTEAPLAGNAESASADFTFYPEHGDDLSAPTASLGLALDRFTMTLGNKLVTDKPVTGVADMVLRGSVPAGPLAATLPVWRDDGGTVDLKRFDITSGGVGIKMTGTLALDQQMRPLGAASGSIRGYEEGIDRLVAGGLVQRRDAQLARLMLSTLAAPDADTGEMTIAVPVTAQDGWLSIGPVRLLKLEPLRFQ